METVVKLDGILVREAASGNRIIPPDGMETGQLHDKSIPVGPCLGGNRIIPPDGMETCRTSPAIFAWPAQVEIG